MRCTAYCCWSYEFECYFPLLHEASVYNNNYVSVKRLIRIGDHVSSRFEFAIKGARAVFCHFGEQERRGKFLALSFLCL